MSVPTSVVSVDPTWNMNTEFGSPCPSNISVPPTSSELVALYTPAVSVWPAPRNATLGAVGVCAAAALYAVVRSDCAWAARALVICMLPFTTTPGGKPVTEVPGLKPRSPLMTLLPVFVTVVAPRTAKLLAVPRSTGPGAAPALDAVIAMIIAMTALNARNAARNG